MMTDPAALYRLLKKNYGPQGWWPLFSVETGLSCYGVIKNKPCYDEMFEIITGAILTQGVAWTNVEKAIHNLKRAGMLNPGKIKDTPVSIIADKIKPSGYFNQKAIKLKNFIEWFERKDFSFEEILKGKTLQIRKDLLSIKGIGPETADSILLYAFNRKIFVVDAYTKRIFSRLGQINSESSYDDVQRFFHSTMQGSVKAYNEYHALIVAHGKDFCKSEPLCARCCINDFCLYYSSIHSPSGE
jgi:endonuclease-3 related protein